MAKYRIDVREGGSVRVTAKYHPKGGIADTYVSTGASIKDLKACMEMAASWVQKQRPAQRGSVPGLQKLTGDT